MKKNGKTKKAQKSIASKKSATLYYFSRNKSEKLEIAFGKILEEERDFYLKEELDKYKNVKFLVL